MRKFLAAFSLFQFFAFSLFADDCLRHKVSPAIRITIPEWTREVAQPDEPMDSMHGSVTASFDEEYDLRVFAQPAESGHCVVLNELDAVVGYTGFLVHIDASHAQGSCEYNMTLDHEDEHIAAHLAALESESENMKKSIQTAADSIMPVFVRSLDGMNSALDKMQDELQSHPDIILMKQKLGAEQEIRNKKVDDRDGGIRINLCK
jgi:hypothetical protein